MMRKRVLITGAAGFIGHHVVDHFLVNTDWELVLLDRLDVSGSVIRFQDSEIFNRFRSRCTWVWWDLKSEFNDSVRYALGDIHYVFHLAASSHVDRSICDPILFVYDNVVGTANLLEYVRKNCSDKFVAFYYFSTDEVFGPVDFEHPGYCESDPYNCRNPYAATKAGAEQLCVAYSHTYGIPIVITRCMNNFGERQHPEKFIPNTIRKVLNGETVLIHSDVTKTISGSRCYIHARNTASAILFLVHKGITSGFYNIVGEKEVSNLEMAKMIANIIGNKLKYEMVDYHSSRPGHDLRYAMRGEKLKNLGWSIPVDFYTSLSKTVLWTIKHPQWL